MVASNAGALPAQNAGYRQAEFWTPDIKVTHAEDGVIYVEQKQPLPAYPERVTDSLLQWADKVPDQTLYAERDKTGAWRRLSFAEAVDKARRLGQYLIDAGLSEDRPLAILSGNSVDHAMLALAAIHVGIPYAAISPAYALVSKDFGRLKEVFEAITPGMIYADDAGLFADAVAAVKKEDTKLLFSNNVSSPDQDIAEAVKTEATDEVDKANAKITGETVAKFLFTSGSTGSPKPVMNTHQMICANQIMTRETFAYFKSEPPVLLDWAPWHHTAGGNKEFFIPVFNGGTLYIDDGKPTPKDISKTIRNLKEIAPTWYFNVPKGFEALIPFFEDDRELRENFFSKVKMLWYAGAGMAQHTWDALDRLAVQTLGEKVLIATGLGATETAPAALMCTWPQQKSGNIGLPCYGVSLKLVPMDGKLDARIKGPNVTPGYWKQPELTAKAFDEEGYYCFGDALRFADPDNIAEGFFFDGRTAENFKLDTGTWVSVGALRTGFINHFGDIVRDVAITGADMPFLGGLVFADEELLRRLAGAGANASLSQLCRDEKVIDHFKTELKELAKRSTGSSNLIRRIILMDVPPSMEIGEATDKGSINQRLIIRNRADAVEEIYKGSPRVIEI